MTVIVPRQDIATRWHGALAGRLKSAPLEQFLFSHGLPLAPLGAARETDNIARAAIYLVERTLEAYQQSRELSASQQWGVARSLCVLCEALATLVQREARWRIAALVSIARLLSWRSDLVTSATFAATVVRDYESPHSATGFDVGVNHLKMAICTKEIGNVSWVSTTSASIAAYLQSGERSSSSKRSRSTMTVDSTIRPAPFNATRINMHVSAVPNCTSNAPD